jgi:hypothetical protein
MSKIATVIGTALGYAAVVLVVGGILLTILTFIVGWLLPLATAGAFAPGYLQVLAIVTLALVARAVVFSGK